MGFTSLFFSKKIILMIYKRYFWIFICIENLKQRFIKCFLYNSSRVLVYFPKNGELRNPPNPPPGPNPLKLLF